MSSSRPPGRDATTSSTNFTRKESPALEVCFAPSLTNVCLPEKLLLDRPIKEYHFVAQAEITIDGVDDKEEMQITNEAFDIMKFSQQEKDELFAITAGLMHMGECTFKQRPREEQAELDSGKGETFINPVMCLTFRRRTGLQTFPI